mgnify:CR=1 FL=1
MLAVFQTVTVYSDIRPIDLPLLPKVLACRLAAPQADGLFPSVYRTRMETVEVDGRRVHRSKGWSTGYWGTADKERGGIGDDRDGPPRSLGDLTGLFGMRQGQRPHQGINKPRERASTFGSSSRA